MVPYTLFKVFTDQSLWWCAHGIGHRTHSLNQGIKRKKEEEGINRERRTSCRGYGAASYHKGWDQSPREAPAIEGF